jgi:Ca-activated chloride channel family protein
VEFVVPPLLWWLALPVALLALYAWVQTRRARHAVPFSSLALIRAAMAGRPSTAGRRHVPAVIVAGSLALAAFSLARPALRTPVPKQSVTVVLVLDVSGSMSANDMFPSRLSAAKRASKSFVDTLPADFLVGVVSFSDQASLVEPVTDDHAAVKSAIDDLKVGGGTAIGDAIEVALAALPSEQQLAGPGGVAAKPAVPLPGQPPPPPPGIILLLTDGENNAGAAPQEAAQKALAANVPVFTVGMGGRGGPFGLGGRASGGVDENLLKEVAAETGGQYYYAPSGGELHRIYSDLGVALGWDWHRREIGQYFAGGAVATSAAGLILAFLWLHRQP